MENIVGSEADDVWMTVEVGIYHGGVLLAPAMYSKVCMLLSCFYGSQRIYVAFMMWMDVKE